VAAVADNFGWLGNAPSVISVAVVPDDSSWWRRQCQLTADGSD